MFKRLGSAVAVILPVLVLAFFMFNPAYSEASARAGGTSSGLPSATGSPSQTPSVTSTPTPSMTPSKTPSPSPSHTTKSPKPTPSHHSKPPFKEVQAGADGASWAAPVGLMAVALVVLAAILSRRRGTYQRR
jgi:hypothetical protein